MNDMKIFENSGFGAVRVVDVNGEPWFVASDIAKALGYERPNDAVNTHCKKVNKFSYGDMPQGAQPYNIIPESDVYRLIMRSNLKNEDVERFQTWVVEEVLPSIRKTGAYSMQGAGRDAPAEDAMFERLWAELERKQKLNGYVDRFCSYFGWSRRYFLSGMYKLMKRNGYNVDSLTLRMQVATHDYAMSTMQAVVMDEEAFNLFCKIAEYGIQRNNIPKTLEEAFL